MNRLYHAGPSWRRGVRIGRLGAAGLLLGIAAIAVAWELSGPISEAADATREESSDPGRRGGGGGDAPSDSSSQYSGQLRVVYTVNNLGFTDTCG